MKRLIFNQFILACLVLNTIFTFHLNGQSPIRSICIDSSRQQNPAFWGDRIVWQDYRNGNWDIYMYDLSTDTEIPICTTSYAQEYPSIWGDRIVWQEARSFDWDIYMYDISSKLTTEICTATGDQIYPAISSDFIVWEDNRDVYFSIHMYDLNKSVESQVPTHNGNQMFPAIWGNRIVWEDDRNGNLDIYMYDISKSEEKAVCIDKADQKKPTIWGDRILWEDYRNGNWDIYMRYINYFTSSDPPEDLDFWALSVYIDMDYDTPSNQTKPKISGNTLAFQDDRTGITKIYTYNFHNQLWGDLVIVDSLQVKQQNPAVSNQRVVWEDLRNGSDIFENWDIYMWTRPAGADLAISHRADPDPAGVYQYLTYTLNIFNHGPMTATGILVQDKPCGDIEMYSITSTMGVCSFDTGVVSCNIDAIPADNSVTITIVVLPTDSGRICNKAYVSSTTPDYIQSNNYTCRVVNVDQYLQTQIGKGSYPSIALDKHNKAHISYSSDTWDLIYKNNKAGSWIKEIIDNTGNVSISEITADRTGNIHLAYVIRDPNLYPLSYLRYTNNIDGYWKQEETIGQSESGIWALSLKVDSTNHIHINYIATMSSSGGGPLIYINDTSGTWTFDTLGFVHNHASMALDSNGYAHISCYMGRGVAYLTNAPDGIWKEPELFDNVGGQLEMMVTSIAIGPDNHPHISYVGGSMEDYKYATKTDTTWYIALIDSGGFQSSGNSIAVDSLGSIHIVYHHIPHDWYNGKPMTLKYATNLSGIWEKEMIDNEGGSFNAIAADNNGNAYITYAHYNGVKYICRMNGTDTDHDGVAGIEEQGEDRNNAAFDGNGDGKSDNQQKNVTSLHTSDGSNYVTIAVQDTSLAIAEVTAIDNPAPNDINSPPDDKAPYGFFSFKIFGLNAGGTAIVRFYLHGGPHIDTYYKYGPTPDTTWHHWYPFTYDGTRGAEINGDTIILHLTDGQRGDHDISVNGIIVEPGGPVSYVSDIKEITGVLPDEYRLWQNYPNPFNPLTNIQFEIPKSSHVLLKIYNILGQEVATLLNDVKKAGRYEIEIDCSSFSSGVYFYRLSAGDYTDTKKFILLK